MIWTDNWPLPDRFAFRDGQVPVGPGVGNRDAFQENR